MIATGELVPVQARQRHKWTRKRKAPQLVVAIQREKTYGNKKDHTDSPIGNLRSFTTLPGSKRDQNGKNGSESFGKTHKFNLDQASLSWDTF